MVFSARVCECYRQRSECFVVRYQGHAVPRLLDLLGRKLLSLLRNTWGALAVSLNCNPLSYQWGYASLAPLKSRSDNVVIPACDAPMRVTRTHSLFRLNMFGCAHVLVYSFSNVCLSFISVSLFSWNAKMKISELHLPSSGLSVGNWRCQAVLHDIVLCSGIRHSLFWVLRIWQHWSGGLPERAGVAQRGNYSDGGEVRQGGM